MAVFLNTSSRPSRVPDPQPHTHSTKRHPFCFDVKQQLGSRTLRRDSHVVVFDTKVVRVSLERHRKASPTYRQIFESGNRTCFPRE